MKKQFLVLAGSALLLASCGGGKSDSAGQTQAQIDSAINAKVAQHDAEVAAKNDSTLKAVEKEKAEARAHERHEEKREAAAAPAPAPQPAPQPAPAPPPAPVNNRPGAAGPKSVNDRPGAH